METKFTTVIYTIRNLLLQEKKVGGKKEDWVMNFIFPGP